MPYTFNPFSGKLDYYPDLSGYVPYVGATADVDLGSHNLSLIGYRDYGEISTPENPSENTIRMYSDDFHGINRLMFLDNSGFNAQFMRDNFIIGRNNTGSNMAKGQVVCVSSSTGNVPTFCLSKADSEDTMPAIGILAENVDDNAFGRAMLYGGLSNIDTSDFDEGDPVYVSSEVNGALTKIKPTYPNIIQRVGIVVVSGVGNGAMEVDTQAMQSTNRVPYTGAVTNVDLGAYGLTADSLALTNPLIVSYGGTGLGSLTQYAIPYADTSSSFSEIPIGTSGQYLKVNATENGYEWGSVSVSLAFIDLTDVPGSYSGQGLKVVRVNEGETGLEFTTAAAGATVFTDLEDVPNSYVGEASKYVKVKATEDGLEFAEGTGGITDHDLLNNLNWAAAGHTFDTNLELGAYYQEFGEIESPETPDSDKVKLYAKDNSGVSALYYIGDDGVEVGPLGAGNGGLVTSVFGRIGDVVAETDDYTWAQINKTVSDLNDLATKSHLSLSEIGINTHAEIDSHIADTSNPHAVTAAQAGAVALTGDESIDGIKTFTSVPKCSTQPVGDDEIPNKLYVDTTAKGLELRAACRVATTANITLSGLQTIDGIVLIADDRVLVKNQTNQISNGIYIAASGAWSRATDYDESSEVQEGTFCNILEGTTNANKQFCQITKDPVLETDPLVFTQLSAAPAYTASNGLTLSAYDFKLGGTLSASTTITQGAYNLTFNLNSTGDFLIQDAGTTRFSVDDTGRTSVGTTPLASTQLYVKPQSDSYKGIVIRQNSATQTANLLDLQNSAGTSLIYARPEGYLYSSITNDQTTYHSGAFTQTPTTLQSYTTGTTDESMDNIYEAFQITSTGAHNIRMIAVDLKRTGTITNPTGYYLLYIYSDNAGVPGSLLATSATRVYFGALTVSYVTYNFGITYTMSNATPYWIVLKQSAAPAGGTIEMRVNNTGTQTYAYSANGSDWTLEDNKSPRYRIYGRTGYAIYGANTANYAGYFNSQTTYAVYAISAYGSALYGNSTNGYGVYGISTYSYGGYFNSSYGTAIYGYTTAGYGLYTTSTTGTGVYGTTTSGTGVYGNSSTGIGVRGNSTSNYAIYSTTTTGTAIYAQTDTGSGIYCYCNNASGNAEQELIRLRRNTSGTAAAGLGAYIDWELEDAGGANRNAGRWSVKWTDATSNAADADAVFQLMSAGTMSEKMRLTDEAQLKLRGTPGSIALRESGSSPTYYTILQSGDLTGSNLTFTLPISDGSNGQVIQTNGSGILSFGDKTVNTDEKVKVDAEATADYLGAAYNDGVLRTDGTVLTYTDGGDYVTLELAYQMSITADESGLSLLGDEEAPGNFKYYGTNGRGFKGWNDLPVSIDEKVKTDESDTTADYLFPKLIAGTGIEIGILSPNGYNRVEITNTAPFVNHDLLSATHPDTEVYSPPEIGDLIVGYDDRGSYTWKHLPKGTVGYVLTVDIPTLPENFGISWEDPNTLINLDDYFYLPGRAGGQIAYGGIDASDNLTLESTSNETKGYLILEPNTGLVGIGTVTPTAKLEIVGSSDITQFIVRANATQSNTKPLIQLLKSDGTVLSAFHSDDPNNIFIGVDTGKVNIPAGLAGEFNIFIGHTAGSANTTGYYNTAVGADSFVNNISGENNVALGALTLPANTTGYFNTAVGQSTLYSNTQGYENTGMGSDALYANTIGTKNIAVGTTALAALTASSGNTAVGHSAGRSIDQANNTFLGYNAGYNVSQKTDAINSMALGYGTYTTKSNQVVIGNTDITEQLLRGGVSIGSDTAPPVNGLYVAGAVGVGIAAPVSALHVYAANYPYFKITDGTTGSTATDGFTLGIATGQTVIVWNYENTDMRFATSGTERITLMAGGDLDPIGLKTYDCGDSTRCFDDITADDFVNVSEWINMDKTQALTALKNIKHKEKQLSNGNTLKYVDFESLPDEVRMYKKKVNTDGTWKGAYWKDGKKLEKDGKEIICAVNPKDAEGYQWIGEYENEVRENSYSLNRLVAMLVESIKAQQERIEILEAQLKK